MIETLLLVSVFAYLLLASINDIKHRFVHDYASYSFGLLFLVLRFLLFFETGSLPGILTVFCYAVPTFLISYFLYKIGAWGGGDVKLLTSVSIGVPFLSTDTTLPFFANFLSNTIISGMAFGIFWALMLIIINIRKVLKELTRLDLIISSVFLIASLWLVFQTSLHKLFALILLFIPLSYLTKKVENVIQVIDKNVKNLEPGDWILSDIKIGRRTVKKTPIGLTKDDIKLLQKTKLRTIKIKDGIPFVPSFLLAFLSAVFYGNIILNIVQVFVTSI